MRKIGEAPMIYTDADGKVAKSSGDVSYFYWKPLLQFSEPKNFTMNVRIPGFRLFVLKEKGTDEFAAAVDLCKAGSGANFRWVAARNYTVGEAILFISEFEEKSGAGVLGGVHARISQREEECNAYLTSNRLLRCT